mmetsp:Transcript_7558/g.13178  ORF Transcript_7558/g.13178 Transcript_7558/m.13178 type:complete len:765 (+) Transcript_7558:174-2468(+)
MREDQVVNGVAFVTHPKVKEAPLEERVSFLKNKGLTQEEIDEVLKRANDQESGAAGEKPGEGEQGPSAQAAAGAAGATTAAAAGINGANMPPPHMRQSYTLPPQSYPPVRQEKSWVSSALVPGAVALSAAAGLSYLYKSAQNRKGGLNNWPGQNQFPGFFNQGQQAAGPNGSLPQQGGPPQSPLSANAANRTSLPGAPGAVEALAGQGKPIPSLESYQAAKDVSLVPMEPSSMFGDAPYATPEGTLGTYTGNSAQNDELKATMKQQTEVLQDVASSLKDLASQLTELKTSNALEAKRSSADPWVASLTQSTSDLKAEMGLIKSLLLNHSGDNKQISEAIEAIEKKSAATTASATQSQLDSLINASKIDRTPSPAVAGQEVAEGEKKEAKGPSDEEILQEKLHGAREALTKFTAACPEPKLRPAVNMLLMYLRNLAKEPHTPRYGRIARANQSFIRALGDLDHVVSFLNALGFEEKSQVTGVSSSNATLEWSNEWRENHDKWAVKVLEDAITNLEAVAKSVTPGVSKPAVVTTEAGAAKSSKEEDKAPAQSSELVKEAVPTAAGFTAPAFQIPGATGEPVNSNPVTELAAGTSATGNGSAHQGREETHALPATTNAIVTSSGVEQPEANVESSADEPKYPLSYAEVFQLVKEGKDPPGIKKIPDELSVDAANPSISSVTPVRKPWEIETDKTAAAGANQDIASNVSAPTTTESTGAPAAEGWQDQAVAPSSFFDHTAPSSDMDSLLSAAATVNAESNDSSDIKHT